MACGMLHSLACQDGGCVWRPGTSSVDAILHGLTCSDAFLFAQGCKVRATKQITISAAPNVLVVHLKRFEYSLYGHKISKKVPPLRTKHCRFKSNSLLLRSVSCIEGHCSSNACLSCYPGHLELYAREMDSDFYWQVEFDTRLDLAPYMSDRRGGAQPYELFGVLVHAGHSVHSGHYYCFVRAANGLWHQFDDHQVKQVGPAAQNLPTLA